MSVAAIYEGWNRVQNRLVSRLPQLSEDDLALRGSPDGWPIWAIIAHLAGTRVYWLCYVCGEPGVETTPFPNSQEEGWEDHLETPRSSAELLDAIRSTGRIVESCVERWTPEMLAVTFPRTVAGGQVQHHSRQSVLTRIVTHDAFHTGEVSLLLGQRGLPSLDPWEIVPPTS